MSPTQLQEWLGAHGQPVVVDGICGRQTREGIAAVFTNACASAVSDSDVDSLATRLGCSAKQLKAVAQVESGGSAFDKLGRPKILFERHLFHRLTFGRHGINKFSNPSPGGYADDSWEKLTVAACKDVAAAFASVSWGKFQVLGAHACGRYSPKFLDLGYPSEIEMAYSTVTGEGAHYDMLARYIEKAGLTIALRSLSTDPEKNVAFAKGYNGPQYYRFDYHNKLSRAMR